MSSAASLLRSLRLRRLLAALAVSAVVGGVGAFRFVLTPSLPRGVYLALSAGTAQVGAIVSFCPPAALGRELVARELAAPGYCAGGSVPLAKRVAALSPWACARPDGLVVDGRLLAWPRIPQALSLHRYGACGPTPPGCVFVLGDSPDSIDSRVFGCVAREALRHRLVPLLTERSHR